MQYEISNRMSDVHGSAIRELFKLGTDPNMISFGGGNPSAETFPVPEIADIIADVMKNAPVSVLQYGLSEGYTPLRDTMKDYLTRTQGFDFENNELFILSGGQQCADLTTKVLVNEGDVILTEDPAFVGCLNTFRSYGAKLIGIPMQQDGMDTDALEAALKAHPEAKLLYTIPSFQNPSGITTTLEKRKRCMNSRASTISPFLRTTRTASCASPARMCRPSSRWTPRAACCTRAASPR